jgi:hypothetical protein
MTPVPDLITKIRHFGMNLLGALLTATNVGLLCLAAFNAEWLPKSVSAAILTCSICVPIACDLIWRYYSEPRPGAWRFLLPGSGGAILFFPVWLVNAVMLLGICSGLTLVALKLM